MEAPSFGETCPTSRSVHAEKGTTSATVTWGPVKATDNHQASVTVFPKVTPPHIFTEGNHTVIYSAKDPSGNMKLCSFKVTVQGKQIPLRHNFIHTEYFKTQQRELSITTCLN